MSVVLFPITEITVPKSVTKLTIVDDSSASLTLLAGATGKRIYVLGLHLFVNGATDLKLKSFNGVSTYTNIDGSMGFAAAGNVVIDRPAMGDPVRDRCFPIAMTNVGEALVLTNSASVRLGGSVFVVQQ